MMMTSSLFVDRLVKAEVKTLIQADATLTIPACTDKCDALLALADVTNEDLTDQLCADACMK